MKIVKIYKKNIYIYIRFKKEIIINYEKVMKTKLYKFMR